jgi:hypothetical protein
MDSKSRRVYGGRDKGSGEGETNQPLEN